MSEGEGFNADVPCPECQRRSSYVKDSRGTQNGSVRRRRECACGHRFTTYERIGRDPRKHLAGIERILEILRQELG